jgi:hypothetical protein
MQKSTQKHPKSTHPKSIAKPEVPAKPRDDGISPKMKFLLIARNLRFFSYETDWFGDPPCQRSPSLEPLGVVGDPSWFGSKKMKRRAREMRKKKCG